jgi:hypothetical protein
MKRILVAVGLTFVAGCATKPPTTANLLLGTWNCESKPSFGTIKGTTTYSPGGKAAGRLTIAGSGGAMAVEATGDVEATWKLLEDNAKLEQTIAGIKIISAKLNGQDIEPGMAQSMVAPMIAGQSTTSTVKVDKTNLVLTSDDGAVTTCTR